MSLFSKGCKKLMIRPCNSATCAFSESMISFNTTFLKFCTSAGVRTGEVVADPLTSTKQCLFIFSIYLSIFYTSFVKFLCLHT